MNKMQSTDQSLNIQPLELKNQATADSRMEQQQEERCIKGIPVKFFIDEVKKQDRARLDREGTLEDFPIQIPGIGLHAIKEKQKVKEEKALGGKAKNPKFQYQRKIADLFLQDERRYKSKEQQIFDNMEDLLDDEKVRQTIEQLEEAKRKSKMVMSRQLTSVVGGQLAGKILDNIGSQKTPTGNSDAESKLEK